MGRMVCASLWTTDAREDWVASLNNYQHALESCAQKKKTAQARHNLHKLDAWMNCLQSKLNQQKYCTLNQLSKLVEWKMLRGQWRPRNQQLVLSNDCALVEQLSKEAFSLAHKEPKKAIGLLTKLKGIGPASASALLACYAPDIFPFMCDEALSDVGLPLKYTQTAYMDFLERIQTKASRLSLLPNEIQQALWASHYHLLIIAKPSPLLSKRKR